MTYSYSQDGLLPSGKSPASPNKSPFAGRIFLTPRDREILEVLTLRLRVLSIGQLARTWWPGTNFLAAARARVRDLVAAGILQVQVSPAQPELPLISPVTTWKVGDPAPEFGAVAYRLQARWKEHPVRTTSIAATDRAGRIFGGHGGRFPREVERTHDLHLAAVYLIYRRENPHLITSWKHEEEIRRDRGRHFERLPDAILKTARGPRAIEFGGSYDKQKLTAFHAYCESKSLSYEVW